MSTALLLPPPSFRDIRVLLGGMVPLAGSSRNFVSHVCHTQDIDVVIVANMACFGC